MGSSCVKLAFDMVDVITSLRQLNNYDLQMRIGIHTGSVLCGVIGSHKWQFDIWSEDVKIANTMEAGGIPDRIHISQATYRALDGVFEVEEGNGSRRNAYIRQNKIRTYLIKNEKEKNTNSIESLIQNQASFK